MPAMISITQNYLICGITLSTEGLTARTS